MPFEKVVTRRFDNLEAHKIDTYVATGGYASLRKALAREVLSRRSSGTGSMR